jgi:SAM-dependent methyltransferase
MCADWNQLFKDPEKIIRDPDPLGIPFIREICTAESVLDLGCGAGRHLVQLACAGLRVIGSDISPIGLKLSREWLHSEGCHADLLTHEMTALPFISDSMGGVISINVLNHGTVADTMAAFEEVYRILKPGRPFFFVIIGRNDARYGEGDEIEPHTFIHRQGIEAGIPHHFFTRDEILQCLSQFSRISIEERTRPYDDGERVFGNDPRLKHQPDAILQHWVVRAWK